MKGKKEFFAHLIQRTGLVRVASALHSALWHDLRVLAYHRVLPRSDPEHFAYDIELVSAWEDDFDWQVGYMARHYQPLTPGQLGALLDAGKPVPRNALLITFDDGYRDNHDIALPILRRHGVAATVFITTGYVDRQEVYWFDRLVHSTKLSRVAQIEVEPGQVLELGHTMGQRQAVSEVLLRHLKLLSDEHRLAAVQRWMDALDVPAPRTEDSLHAPMSWAHVRNLAASGIEIGSHTVTHPVLSSVASDAQLMHELRGSRLAIEAHTGRPVTALAYPVGGPRAYDERVVRAVRNAGYRFAFTYTPGLNSPASWDLLRLNRWAMERYVSRNRFRAMLAAPLAFV